MLRHSPLPLFLCLWLAPGGAWSGAWTLSEGEGQLITTTGRTVAPVGAIFGDAADEDTSSFSVFVEYGVTDRLTVGATGSAEWLATTNQMDVRIGAHGRYRIWQGDSGDVFSVQAGASFPIEGWFGDPLAGPTGDSVTEAQIGLNYGRGWVGDWGNSFITTEVAYRWRSNGAGDEARFELTGGHAFSRRLMAIVSTFTVIPFEGPDDPSLKIAPSVAWTFWPSLGQNDKKPADFPHPRTIQLGIGYDVLNPGDGLDISVSVWSRF